eukprot:gene10389-biopygen8352
MLGRRVDVAAAYTKIWNGTYNLTRRSAAAAKHKKEADAARAAARGIPALQAERICGNNLYGYYYGGERCIPQ